LQFQIVVVALIIALVDYFALGVVGRESSLPNHTVISTIATENELIVDEVLRFEVGITVDYHIAWAPAALPSADNRIAQSAPIVVTPTT
jgi:hypothetical protein